MAQQLVTRRPTADEVKSRKANKPPKALKPSKELLAIEKGDLAVAVSLMFWKMRNLLPDFAITITEQDVKDMKASLNHLEQKPVIVVEAHHAMLVVRAVDQHGNQLQAAESTEAQLLEKERAQKTRRLREQVPFLVSTVRSEIANNIISNDSINRVCEAAMAMAQE